MKDDGIGFKAQENIPPGGKNQGIGLLGMQERVHSLGGTFTFRSSEGKGTLLRAELPIQEGEKT